MDNVITFVRIHAIYGSDLQPLPGLHLGNHAAPECETERILY